MIYVLGEPSKYSAQRVKTGTWNTQKMSTSFSGLEILSPASQDWDD